MSKLFLLLFMFVSCSSYKALKCGHLLDTQKNHWLTDQVLLLKDGKIVGLNPKTLPARTTVYDYSSSYVIPGLIDAHTHLFLEENTFAQDFSKGLLDFITTTSDEERRNLGVRRAKSLLKRGFTSVRDLGNDGGLSVPEEDPAHTRIFSSGPGYSPKNGQFPPGTDLRIVRKEYPLLSGHPPTFKNGLVKLYADEDPNASFADPQTFTTWVQSAHAQGLKVAAHATLAKGIDIALKAHVDTIEHGTFITQEQLKEMKNLDITFVPTHADSIFLLPKYRHHQIPYTKELVSRTCENMRAASDLGVHIAFGSDNYFSLEKEGLSFGEATLEVLFGYRNCGLTGLSVLRAATFEAARSMGREKDVGQLSEGAYADVLILKSNPAEDLETLRSPEAIFFRGNLL